MTREEAIHYGKDYLKDLTTACCHIEDKHKDFVRMAIKALEQEPCDNAISRQAALNYIYNDLGLGDEENGNDVERQMELDSSYRYIKSLPSVNPTKTGHWIDEFGGCECSECGCLEGGYSDYCPNCGAKMESEVEDGKEK